MNHWLVNCLKSTFRYPLVEGLFIGSCVSLGFLFSWGLYPATLALFLFAWRVMQERNGYQLALFGWGFFTAKAAGSLAWGIYLFPILWLPPLAPFTMVMAIFLYWLTSAIALGLPGLLLGGYVNICRLTINRWRPLRGVALGVGVMLIELLGALIFSVVLIGPGGKITAAFSFGHIGYLVSQWPLFIHLAKYGGVYILTVVGLIIIVIILSVLNQGYKKIGLALAVILLGMTYISTQNSYESANVITVASINTNFIASTSIDIAYKTKIVGDLVDEANRHDPDYIVLPEDSRYLTEFFHARESGIDRAYEAFAWLASTSAPIVDSGVISGGSYNYEKSFYLDAQATTTIISSKTYLVPQGEYIPYITSGFLRLMGQDIIAEALKQNIKFGIQDDDNFENQKQSPVSVMFCFESVMPWRAKQLALTNKDMDFIAHPFSHAKFNNPHMFSRELDLMLQVQAVFSGKPIVSAGNMGQGKLYLPDGSIEEGETVYTKEAHEIRLIRF